MAMAAGVGHVTGFDAKDDGVTMSEQLAGKGNADGRRSGGEKPDSGARVGGEPARRNSCSRLGHGGCYRSIYVLTKSDCSIAQEIQASGSAVSGRMENGDNAIVRAGGAGLLLLWLTHEPSSPKPPGASIAKDFLASTLRNNMLVAGLPFSRSISVLQVCLLWAVA